MSEFTQMQKDIESMLQHRARFKFYSGSVSANDYDDAHVLTQSGSDVWLSGLVLPVKDVFGSREAVLLQQGKITTADKRLYIKGTTTTVTPSPGALKIGLGSPIEGEYNIIPDGEEAWPPIGDIVYKKLYIRALPNGSLIGEM